MNEEFGPGYAESYDALYGEKDYAGERDLIERVIRTYGRGDVSSILDLGCGTGTHAILLARGDHEVVGVDRSASMVEEAQRKAAGCGPDVRATIVQGDARTLDLGRCFDVVLMMFGVAGYQQTDADVIGVFRTARRHLEPGGLLLCEVWFGPAVLHQRPSPRVKTVPIPGGHVVRSSVAELDARRRVCTIHFHVRRSETPGQAVETEETHRIRYFFRDELETFLTASDLSLVRVGAFPAFAQDPDDSTWNVLAVARAV